MKVIKGIGFSIPSDNEDDYISLDSNESLSECDIVIINPSTEYCNYSTDISALGGGFYNGHRSYNDHSSMKIKENLNHWRKEIQLLLNVGKTVFITLSKKELFYIRTGRQEFSGTGRNQKVTNIVTDFSNYNYIPNLSEIKVNNASGIKIISTEPILKQFVNEFEDYLKYEAYLEIEGSFRECIMTRNKDKIIGGIVRIGTGHMVFIPTFDFSHKDLYEFDENDNHLWTKAAKIIGTKLCQSLIEIDSTLRKDALRTPRPNWLSKNEYRLPESDEIQVQISSTNKQINKLKIELSNEQLKLEESEKINDLLFEKGLALENAVTIALKILGYDSENYDDGKLELDQVIISPEGVRLIGECEGKDNKSIDITKFRQLSDALNEDFERDEVEEKAFGLLFGNPYRLKEPKLRKNPFTTKCISGAKREMIGLIETRELYRVVKYLKEKDDDVFRKKCRKAIIDRLGSVITFPLIKQKVIT